GLARRRPVCPALVLAEPTPPSASSVLCNRRQRACSSTQDAASGGATMGLFRRWFGGTERTSGEAVASPAPPETLEQQGRRNAVSDGSVRSDGEQGEDSRIRAKIKDLVDAAIRR